MVPVISHHWHYKKCLEQRKRLALVSSCAVTPLSSVWMNPHQVKANKVAESHVSYMVLATHAV